MAVVLAGTAITLITWQRHDLIEGVDAALRREADSAQAMLISDNFIADNSGEDRGVQIVGPDGSVIAAARPLPGSHRSHRANLARQMATLRLPIDDDTFRLLRPARRPSFGCGHECTSSKRSVTCTTAFTPSPSRC
jgi:hypothetical protein